MLQLKTKQELIDFLTKYKSVKTATIVSKTELRMNKKEVATKQIPNPFGDEKIYKVSLFNGDINFDYETVINDARLLEGKDQNFEASSAKWGDYVSPSLTKKEDDYYLKIIPTKSLTTSTYEKEDGSSIDIKQLEDFIPKKKPSTKQELDKEVPYRVFKLSSIIHLKIDGIMSYTQE